MPIPENTYPTQHIGGTILVVMMEVDPEHEDEFNRWYNEEHLLERLEIPGYISARRFKLSLQVEDEQNRVVDAIRDLQVDLENLSDLQKVLLRLNIALHAKE